MRPPRIRGSSLSLSRVMWLTLTLATVLLFSVYSIISLRKLNRDIAVLSEERERLKQANEELTIQVGDMKRGRNNNIGVDVQPSPRADVISPPVDQQQVSQSELSFPFSLMNVRLSSYRIASKEPRCNFDGVYTEVKVLTGLNSESSQLTCKIKRGGQAPDHGLGLHCWGRFMAIDANKISVSRGGEDVLSVMGRSEEAETANVQAGAFTFSKLSPSARCNGDALAQWSGVISRVPYMGPLLNSMCSSSPSSQQCESHDPIPTIVVHRYEYVNIYHTGTELASAHMSIQSAIKDGLVSKDEKIRVVVIDGHAKGSLDSLWSVLFSDGHYEMSRIGHLRGSPLLCLERFILSETGYASPINIHQSDGGFGVPHSYRDLVAPLYCYLEEVADFSKKMASLGDGNLVRTTKPLVLFIARDKGSRPAHPRVAQHNPIERGSSSNAIQELKDRAAKLSADKGLDVRIMFFTDLSMSEQIGLVRSADVIISFHGAALTHLVWGSDKTFFIELCPDEYSARIHFPKMAARTGKHFARMGRGGGNFLAMGGSSHITFDADMLESIVSWSLIKDHDKRLQMISNGNSFL